MISTFMMSLVASLIAFAHPQAQLRHVELNTYQTACLAETVYFESRGEGVEGEEAVAYVVLNRSVLKRQSICDVVHAKDQFSYYYPGERLYIHDKRAWLRAIRIAIDAQLRRIRNPIGNATFYNTSPFHDWRHIAFVKKINHQYFYEYRDLRYRRPMLHYVAYHPQPRRISYVRHPVYHDIPYHRSLCHRIVYHVVIPKPMPKPSSATAPPVMRDESLLYDPYHPL